MNLSIRRLRALQILDSRGKPTIAVEAELTSGATAWAQIPSGASTGRHEAVELRDGDSAHYGGQGVQRAVENVENVLSPALEGMDADDQSGVDERMIELDGTVMKSRLGANAILGASCAVARAASVAKGIPLWKHLKQDRVATLPVPMVNIFSGGLHADHSIEFQDFLAIPHGFSRFSDALEAVVAVHRTAFRLAKAAGYTLTGVADEGGWGPHVASNEHCLKLLTQSIEEAGYKPGEEVSIALDVASSHFFDGGSYHLKTEGRVLDTRQMIDLIAEWSNRYPILSVEDGLEQDDWAGWSMLNSRLGDKLQIVGDDLFTTNPARVEEGIRLGAANSVLVKMNQIGTLTETFQVIDRARKQTC